MTRSRMTLTDSRPANGKISYFTGLKGIACLIVALNHFGGAFFPADTLQQNIHFPLQLFFNGTFMVQVFFLASGFFVGYSFFRKHDMEKLEKSAVLRWFRLTLPVAAVCAIIWLVMKTGAYSAYDEMREITGSFRKEKDAFNYSVQLSFAQLIVTSLTFLMKSVTEFTFVLWMMHDLFIGFFIAVILTLLLDRLSPIYALMLTGASLFFLRPFLWTFAFGPMLAYFFVKHPCWLQSLPSRITGVIGALAAFYIGNWPYCEQSGLKLYWPLEKIVGAFDVHYSHFYALGAVCACWALMTVKPLQTLFSLKPLMVLGDCSFAVYLLHDMIEIALGANVFLLLYRHVTTSIVAVTLLTGIVSLSATIAAAYLFHRFVETPCLKVCDRIYGILTGMRKRSKDISDPEKVS